MEQGIHRQGRDVRVMLKVARSAESGAGATTFPPAYIQEMLCRVDVRRRDVAIHFQIIGRVEEAAFTDCSQLIIAVGTDDRRRRDKSSSCSWLLSEFVLRAGIPTLISVEQARHSLVQFRREAFAASHVHARECSAWTDTSASPDRIRLSPPKPGLALDPAHLEPSRAGPPLFEAVFRETGAPHSPHHDIPAADCSPSA